MHNQRPNYRNRSGPITIGVIFALGLAVLALFWRATRSSDPAPADAKFAVPAKAIRVISMNLSQLDRERSIDAINASNADVVLLQHVPTTDVAALGQAINMSRSNQPSGDVFYPAQNFEGPATPYGNAIFSRFPLHEGRSIPNRGGSFGVWAVAVIDGAKIMVASIQPTDSSSEVPGTQDAISVRAKELATLARAHQELGDPPIILGGTIGGFTPPDRDALAGLAQFVNANRDELIVANGWRVRPAQTELGFCCDLVAR